MKILLKDPALVEAVIRKMTGKYPAADKEFAKHCVPYIEANLENGDMVLLNVTFRYDVQMQTIVADMYYDLLKEIPTDKDFLNDKEWQI